MYMYHHALVINSQYLYAKIVLTSVCEDTVNEVSLVPTQVLASNMLILVQKPSSYLWQAIVAS